MLTERELDTAMIEALQLLGGDWAERLMTSLGNSPVMCGLLDACMEPLHNVKRGTLIANGLATALLMGMIIERNRNRLPEGKPC